MATLSEYRERPHWSYSAVNQFVNICSLQYAFDRIYRLPRAFVPVALSFGSAFHRTCEWVNRNRMEGSMPGASDASALFRDLWSRQLAQDGDIRFDEGQTPESCGRQGADMIECLVKSIDPAEQVLSVCEPFAVPLVDTSGNVLEDPLIGELDTVVVSKGRKTVVDWKTSARRWPKDKSGLDLQPTAFLYGYVHLHGELPEFRFDVVVKNKVPVFEQHVTARTADRFARLVELVKTVERAVAAEAFFPNEQSYYCAGCCHVEACRAWHRHVCRVNMAA